MSVSESLRSTRLGRLKYDKHWLEEGRVSEILDLCNSFSRTLTFSPEQKRVIATSPRSNKPVSETGLGGGEEVAEPHRGRAGLISSDNDALSSDLPDPNQCAISRNGTGSCSREGAPSEEDSGVSGFELAALKNEIEWQERTKAAVDKRLKLFRVRWEECRKKAVSPPTSSWPVSPVDQPVSPVSSISPTVTAAEPFLPSATTPDVEVFRTNDSSVAVLSSRQPQSCDQDTGITSEETQEQPAVPSPQIEERPCSPRTPPSEIVPPVIPTCDAAKLDSKVDINENRPTESPRSVKTTSPTNTCPDIQQQEGVSGSESEQRSEREVIITKSASTEAKPRGSMEEKEDPGLAHVRLTGADATRFVSAARLNEYKRHIADWIRQKEWYDNVQRKMSSGLCSKNADRVTKGIRQDLTVGIQTTINQLSKDNVKESLVRLGQLLEGRTVVFCARKLSIQKHADAKQYCFELIARTLVKQAENVVSVQREMAYPLAAVAVSLSVDYPEIRDFIMAIVYSNCLYLLPYYIPRSEAESDQDYFIKLGYQRVGKGELEQQHLFLGRMSGICRFWAAMICAPATSWRQYPTSHYAAVRSTNPHPVDFHVAWRFLAAMVQLAPRIDITAIVLTEFLQITSHFLRKIYGKQYEKLLRFIGDHYMAEIDQISTGGLGSAAFAQLKAFLSSGSKRYSLPVGYPASWRRCS